MTDAIRPIHRAADDNEQRRTRRGSRAHWVLPAMRVHLALAGIAAFVAAVGLTVYLFNLQLTSLKLDWETLKVSGTSKVYETETQVLVLVIVVLGFASLVLLRTSQHVGARRRTGRWTGAFAALLLLTGFPAAWVFWHLDISYIPASASTWVFGAVAGVLVLQSWLAVWYLVRVLFSRQVRQALSIENTATNPALRRVQRAVIGLWVLVVIGMGVTLGVMTDWLYELPVPDPEPGELLYATSFDTALSGGRDTDRLEWDTYEGSDEARIESKSLTLASDIPSDPVTAPDTAIVSPDAQTTTVPNFPAVDNWLAIKYGSGLSEEVVWSTLDRRFGAFDLRVTVRQISGPLEDSQYGVIFRYRDDENFYMFRISGDADYSLIKVKDGVFEEVSPWTWIAPDVIRSGELSNDIRVVGAGNQFRFFVNGEPLVLCLRGENLNAQWSPIQRDTCWTADPTYVYEDDDFEQGQIALATGTISGSTIEAAFDNLTILGPKPNEMQRTYPGDVVYSASFEENDFFNPYADEWTFFEGDSAVRLAHTARISVAEDRSQQLVGPILVVTDAGQTPGARTWSPLDRQFADMDLQVRMWPAAGPPDSHYGVLFRFQDAANYFALIVRSDGQYAVEKVQNGERQVISAWHASEAIAGIEAANELRVVAVGDSFRFFANGEPLPLCLASERLPGMWSADGTCLSGPTTDILVDAAFGQGRIALMAGTGQQTGRPVMIEAAALYVYRPDPSMVQTASAGNNGDNNSDLPNGDQTE
ncbi:MAG: hypothetical protein GYB65_07825 [Chloroflexi bacterium]|nr:hypothetical protein [Chloroflexota bacterium]